MIFNRAENRKHLVECLHRVLEANLPWLNISLYRCLAHELPNQVVRNHVGANLVAYAMRFFASQVLHLHVGFE